ncbi:hypothetical protein VKS41_003484 [Umbelopsis sp. WA50703]
MYTLKLAPFVSLVSWTIVNAASLYQQASTNQISFAPEQARFDGYKVVEACLTKTEDIRDIMNWIDHQGFDIWKTPTTDTCFHVRVDDRQYTELINHLPVSSTHKVIIPNVQSLIDETVQSMSSNMSQADDFLSHYHKYDEIIIFMKNISDTYPDLVDLFTIGKTYEGRDIWGITIKSKKAREGPTSFWTELTQWWNPQAKKAKPHHKEMELIMHGGQHAREWISVAVLTYFIETLTSKYGQDKHITKLVDEFSWTLIPVMNVDGYIYSHEQNRMWRKNRQPTPFPFCSGIDLNRNWGYEWNRGGSSANPCSEAYMGPEAFAAVETKLMADFVASRKHALMYIDFHSYSQLWMTPFGSDCNERPKDEENLEELALGATKALKAVHGTSFAAGSVCKIIYQASGGSLDWTYAVANVKYSFAVELRDVGRYGFLLPEDQIIPSGEETLAGILFAAKFISEREKGSKGH